MVETLPRDTLEAVSDASSSLSVSPKSKGSFIIGAPSKKSRGLIATNPSSLIRYGQEGWYPRRDPTTRLAALDAERIPNRKGTSRCVNDDPAPGQG